MNKLEKYIAWLALVISLATICLHVWKNHLKQEEEEHLLIDLDDAFKMLLLVEEQIRKNHPEFQPI